MKIQWLHELVDYLYGDRTYDLRNYILEQTAKSKDTSKGFFWEHVLAKKMKNHTKHLGGSTAGKDFDDYTEAKLAVFYKKRDGVLEASVSGVRTKIGDLRVCLVVPGEVWHRVYFMYIPHDSFQKYLKGSDALKITLDAKTGNIKIGRAHV